MMNSMIGRKSALWLAAAAISVLAFANVQTANGATRERPCNGSVELCSRTLDQVVLPGTHNSMSNEEYCWSLPNQHYSIPTQLSFGVRSLLIDTHYGKPDGDIVFDWNSGADGNPHDVGAPTYLCHSFCTLGASKLDSELAKVADFLRANPREVMIFVVQNGIHPDDYATAVNDSGLIDFVYTGATDSYPTLRQMIAANERVVMLSEGGTGSVPWFHNGYAGPLQETPYDFRRYESNDLVPNTQAGMDLLTQPGNLDSSCRPNRGGTTGPLFLMNHWVNGLLAGGNPVTPDPAVSQILNQPDVLVARAQACQQRRGELPNIVAVDGFGDGDLTAAVRELNGVSAKPFFEIAKPKNATVKAGKKATYRLGLSNFGDTESALTRVCAIVPGRLAVKPGCKTFFVPFGRPGKATTSISITTRRNGKGAGKVTFKVSGGGDATSTSASLKVNPVKKKKKPKRARR